MEETTRETVPGSSGTQMPSYSYNAQMSGSTQPAKASQTGVSPAMAYQTAFPEIYYKLQPYIMMVCDQIDALGSTMPSQDMLDRISDSIYDDMNRRYPDLAEYARTQEEKANSDPVIQAARFGDDPPMFGWRFRRRGLFRDLIDILLLSELFRRRRRF
jgi:hypothetical protein